MGQQTLGHYPVHFHMNGDVDERGGYDPPTSVMDLSIHHSFSRCVTIHASNGLLVSLSRCRSRLCFSFLVFCLPEVFMRRKCYAAIHYNDFQGRKSFPKFCQV